MFPRDTLEAQIERGLVRVPGVEVMETLGMTLASRLQPGDWLLLEGSIGTGKSVLVRSLARALGASEWRGSPTFTLINEYDSAPPLTHIDLYRLAPGDVKELGLDDAAQPSGITAVEWADRGGEVLDRLAGPHAWRLEIDYVGPWERHVRITPPKRTGPA